MGRLTYLKNGRPCVLVNGAEVFGPVAERLHAYEETGYEPCGVHDLSDRCAKMALERGQRQLEVALALDALSPEDRHELEHNTYGPLHRKIGTWMMADAEGRLLVLPCSADITIERDGFCFKGDHWNPPYLTAFADDPTTRSGERVALFSPQEVEAALRKEQGDG